MKKLIIDREKWRRGFDEDTYLLSRNGMCCLGFDALNEGLEESEIRDVYSANDVKVKINGITYKNQWWRGTKICRDLETVNDDTGISEDKRETKITKLFAKIGREVEFIN